MHQVFIVDKPVVPGEPNEGNTHEFQVYVDTFFICWKPNFDAANGIAKNLAAVWQTEVQVVQVGSGESIEDALEARLTPAR